MATRNLDALFRPQSIALFGADTVPLSRGSVLAKNLFAAGFHGPILPVHPTLGSIQGVYAFRTLAELPLIPDLAVIANPSDAVPELLAELGARGTRAAIVLAGGDGRAGGRTSERLRERLLAAARPHGLRLLGPTPFGLLVPALGLNASYAHRLAVPGEIALVAQSASLTAWLLDWVAGEGIGLSLVTALGEMADTDLGDLLNYLALDRQTQAIILCIDEITRARKFMTAARSTARIKPVIVLDAGQRAGEDPGTGVARAAVYDAAFRRAGMLPVPLVTDLVAAARTLGTGTRLANDRIAILSNGRGVGDTTAALLVREGGRLARLSERTVAALAAQLPAAWNRRNPINLFQSATPECHAAAVGAVLDDAGSDAVLVLHGPTALADPLATAAAIAARLAHRRKPVAVVWLDRATRTAAQDILAAQRVPVHDNQRQAIAAFLHLVAYHRNQDMLMQTPASVPDRFERDQEAVLAVVHRALETGREWLDEPETLAVLAAYGVPVARLRGAATVEDAVRAAGEIGYPVRLDRADAAAGERGTDRLDEAGAVRAGARWLERRHRERRPEQAFPGWVVRPAETAVPVGELWLGVALDRRFGPVIVFGRGGSRRAVHPDHAVGLPPLNLTLAKRLMAETRVYHDLAAAGQCAPESLEELALLLVKLSQLTAEVAEIVEIDIDPLPITRTGLRVGSARARVAPATGAAADRLAIRPYPNELEKAVISRAGRTFLLRPIRPEDEPALQEFVRRMDPEDIRMRFFSSIRELDHRLAARLSQIDYDREMAFVLVDPHDPAGLIYGVMRLSADAEGDRAEYAGAVRSDMKGHGLGRILMQEIVAYGRQIGLREIWGEVLAQNASMLGLAENLGFRAYPVPDDPSCRHVTLALDPT